MSREAAKIAKGNRASLKIGYLRCYTGADPQHNAADEILTDCRGAKEAGVIFGTGTWDKGDVYRHPSLEQACEMEKEL